MYIRDFFVILTPIKNNCKMLKQFFRVLARYMLPYRMYIVGAVLLNIFSQWMNVFSFVVLIPILNILFKIDQTVYHYKEWTWSTLDKETITLSDKAVINYKASGGTEKYKFTSFYRLDGASKWTMISMRKGASSCSFIPESKGSYKVCIKVKDTNKIEKKQYFNLEVV